MTKRKNQQKKSKKKNKKRKSLNSGSSGDKRQRLPSNDSDSYESTMSEALPSTGETKEDLSLTVIPLPLITKEDGAAARRRQGYAKSAETLSPPCIAILYTKIKWKRINGKHIKGHFVPIGKSIIFTSRLEASESEVLGGMNRKTIITNIDKKGRSKIKGGDYDGLYVMFSNIIVEPIIFEGIEIKPAPAVSERVKGDLYVVNGKVRICGGHRQWKCTEHNKVLSRCVPCGGASICDCGIDRSQCRICRVQPLLKCMECPQTCRSAAALKMHMCTHTGDKPFECNLCSYRFATNGHLTSHKGHVHDIGNEQCTNCNKNCYRPRSWIDVASKEEVKCCKTCYQNLFGVNIRGEQEWSDWLDKRFYPEFRTCSDTRISMCTRFRPDGLYEFEGQIFLYFDHLILHQEHDEHQHSGERYSGDENRMLKMHEIEKYKDKQWVTVRVNPHGYTHPAHKPKPKKEERKELMLKVMKACLTKKWESRTNVIYMFYSENNPNIAKNISKTMLYDAEDVDNFCKNI
tara:strand:- start:620 stop:2170 length:1551 start_codon:yes stop_codon:yes gene_type:complete